MTYSYVLRLQTFTLFYEFYGSWLVLAISYPKLSTINKLKWNKINKSEASWREHVVWSLLFGNYTLTHSGSFPYIHKACHK